MPAERSVGRLVDKDELTRVTSKYMMGNLEWSGPMFQAATLFVSSIFDPFVDGGSNLVLYLAIAHLPIAVLYLRGYGPLALGGWWTAVYPVQAVATNGLLMILSQPQTYGQSLLCVPGCNYSAPMWLFLAYYPWPSLRLERWRRPLELLMLAAYFTYYVMLTWINNGEVEWRHLASIGISVMWLLTGYILGVAVSKMCVAAAEKQLEVQQQNFTEFFDFLHSHVKSGIAAIRTDLSDQLRTREKLNELEETVGSYRVELLLSQEQVPLAALFSERIRTFAGVLEINSSPRIGQLSVARPIGVLVGRTLGDLLKNAAKYGATAVDIDCKVSHGQILVEISDNGPGLPAEMLEDESRSLSRLRSAARSLGGDLITRPRKHGSGAILSLTAPLHVRKV